MDKKYVLFPFWLFLFAVSIICKTCSWIKIRGVFFVSTSLSWGKAGTRNGQKQRQDNFHQSHTCPNATSTIVLMASSLLRAGVTKAKRAKDHVDEGLEKVRSKRWPLGKVLQVSCKIVGAVALNCSNNLTTRSWGKHHRRSSIFWCHPSQPGADLGDRSSHRRNQNGVWRSQSSPREELQTRCGFKWSLSNYKNKTNLCQQYNISRQPAVISSPGARHLSEKKGGTHLVRVLTS